jgi:hypothetical protein
VSDPWEDEGFGGENDASDQNVEADLDEEEALDLAELDADDESSDDDDEQ